MRAFIRLVALVTLLAPTTSQAQEDRVGVTARDLIAAAAQTDSTRDERIGKTAAAFRQALTDWDRAIQSFEVEAQRELPSASADRAWRLHLDLGIAYRNRGRLTDAIKEFDSAARLRSGESDVQLLRAGTLEADGQAAAAADAFLMAWHLAPRDPAKTYETLRRGIRDADERGRAVAVLEQTYRDLKVGDSRPVASPLAVADVLPDWASPTPIVGDDRTAAGFALLAAGRYSEGVAALTQGLQNATRVTESPLEHFKRAQRLESDGQVSEARREYAAALTGTLAGRSVIFTRSTRD